MAQTAVILLILWALGLMTGTLFGGLTHLLLIVAIVMLFLRIAHGRGVLRRG